MGYKDKIIKKRLFCQSLMTLKDFACSKPELSLENKQAIIGAIALGGSLQTPGPRNKIQTYYHFNYHYTQRGLIRAFSDKLIQTDSEEKQKVKKAICVISSLSSWANENPQLSLDAFQNFSNQILDKNNQLDAVAEAQRTLKQKYGHEILLDLVTMPGNRFYKKYNQK